MKRTITIGTLLLLTFTTNISLGQAEQVSTESETHIFWQPDRILTENSVPGYGIVSIMFKSVEARAAEMRDGLINAYVKDVYIDNKPGAFEMWRERIDAFLAESEEYATKPEDCFRFVKNAPIDENYETAKTVTGNLY